MFGCLTVCAMKAKEETVRQFVPMSDELLYRSEVPPGPLVPYRCGLPCWHQLRADCEKRSDDDARDGSGVRAGRGAEAVSA